MAVPKSRVRALLWAAKVPSAQDSRETRNKLSFGYKLCFSEPLYIAEAGKAKHTRSLHLLFLSSTLLTSPLAH